MSCGGPTNSPAAGCRPFATASGIMTCRSMPQDSLWRSTATFFATVRRRARPERAELEAVASASGFLASVEDEFGPEGLEVLAELVGRETLRALVDQAARYFAEEDLRQAVRQRLADVIRPDTRVVVAHSMGTIVAYEALAEHPEWPVTTFVTIGSPLGNDFVFDSLSPSPEGGIGAWPGSIETWANVAAVDDPVIDEPNLARRFGDRVVDFAVDNGRDAHRAEPYLNAAATGAVIALALRSAER